MLPSPLIDPVAFALGPLQIRWYGLSYVVGIGVAWWLLNLRARSDGFGREEVGDLVFHAALGGVLGGRLGYILFYNLPVYIAEPLKVFAVWEGGMSFHGGLLGCAAALIWHARTRKRSWLEVADFLVPVVPVALFFGRLGNFANGELWGAPTALPWGVIFPEGGPLPRHPTQLYEAALEGLLLFALLWRVSATPRSPGLLSGIFLCGYALARSVVEFWRVPDAHIGYLAFGWVTMGQLLSAPMLVLGIGLVAWSTRRRSGMVKA